MKKSTIYHPFLFSVIPVLFLFTQNMNEVSLSETVYSFAASLCFTLILMFIANLILKDKNKSGIIVSMFLILFFTFGRVHSALEEFQFGRYRNILLILSILFGLGLYLIIKTDKKLHEFTNSLNIFALVMVLLSITEIIVYELQNNHAMESNLDVNNSNVKEIKKPTYRDIYYIILDGYARSSTLEEIYSYDNTKFIGFLEKKGFYIGSKTRSNYAMTFLSLASSLNMDYLNNLTEKVGIGSVDRKLPYNMIKKNKVTSFLKSIGYKTIYFGSGWGPTKRNKYADMDFGYRGSWNAFEIALMHTTLMNPFVEYFNLFEQEERIRVINTFSKLGEIQNIEGPKFVFAHIVCPHEPYVFGANGEHVEHNKDETVLEKKQQYINQLIYINDKVTLLINEIISKSKISPIVILQADHGPASSFALPSPVGWKSPTELNLRERMRIFSAYHLPAGGDTILYESITPVNTFRMIFNFYFNTHFILLNDKSYYSTYQQPYKFIDVTNIAK